jgi:hypothetical protein
MATFSKPSNVILIAPILLVLATRGRWMRGITIGALFGLVVGGFFLANLLITGDWNFQGGDRNTYYGAFPFLTGSAGFDVGLDRATNEVLTNIVFDPTVFWSRLGWNLVYFVFGRHSGLLPYFFPGLFAAGAFLWPRAVREPWQWLVAGAIAAEILLVLVWIPYNYFGGGGVLGNRYFMSTYGLLLFLLPPIESIGAALVPWFVGALFTAQIVLNRVLGVVQSGRTRQERPAALAAGGNDDAEHPANHDPAGSGARPVRRQPAVPDLLPRRQHVPP